MTAKSKTINRLAWAIHKCPPGYEGPCWGPTQEDLDKAKEEYDSSQTPHT